MLNLYPGDTVCFRHEGHGALATGTVETVVPGAAVWVRERGKDVVVRVLMEHLGQRHLTSAEINGNWEQPYRYYYTACGPPTEEQARRPQVDDVCHCGNGVCG